VVPSPWRTTAYVELGVKALVEMGVFLTLLSLGVAYAWREGALTWQ
jgi:NADH-quinone oxidoreductase subunit A